MKISVLGSGSWGTALAMVLDNNGHNVYLWSFFDEEIKNLSETRENKLLKGVKINESIRLTSDLDEAVCGAEMLVIAVPSHIVKKTAQSLKKYGDLPLVVNVAKGFDEENDKRLSVILKEELNTDKVVILSGPTHAEEVSRGIPTTIVAACENEKYAKCVQNAFMNENFRVYTNTDVAGVEVAGATKNVIALCAGISDGCGFGDNTKAALMTRGMKEIVRLGTAMGGKSETFAGLTGMGDLIVTCTSMHSRNRRAGILIGQGKTKDQAIEEVGMVVEGVKSCKSVYKLAKEHKIEMPIVEAAYNVLYNNISAIDAVKTLMTREKKEE